MTNSYDLAVVGGGIFGLSIARAGARAGLKVAVIERDRIGAGASGGVLGALMPHMPARWNDKKAFQFSALTSLEEHIRALEQETNQVAGYRRCGRVMPITSEDRLLHQKLRAEESIHRWASADTGFFYKIDNASTHATWLTPEAAPFGVVYETLSARVAPQSYLDTLTASLTGTFRDKVDILLDKDFASFDEATGAVRFDDGSAIASERLVLASGYRAFEQILELTGQQVGSGEKGQALLMEGSGLEAMPAVYCDGIYVVPHDDHTVAVGSTADRDFADVRPDEKHSEDLAGRARAFCPALARRKVIRSWAGIRPRCHSRDPLIGLLPQKNRTYVATGGYKISFGIAHLIADALIADMTGGEVKTPLPETFRSEHHLEMRAPRTS